MPPLLSEVKCVRLKKPALEAFVLITRSRPAKCLSQTAADFDQICSNFVIGRSGRDGAFDGANACGCVVLGERPLDAGDVFQTSASAVISLELTAADTLHRDENSATAVGFVDGDNHSALVEKLAALRHLNGAFGWGFESLDGGSGSGASEAIEWRTGFHRLVGALGAAFLHGHALFSEPEHGLRCEPADPCDKGADHENLSGRNIPAESGGCRSEKKPAENAADERKGAVQRVDFDALFLAMVHQDLHLSLV